MSKSFNVNTSLVSPSKKGLVSDGNGVSNHMKHTLISPGKERRTLRVPHPCHYYFLSSAISNNWNAINSHLSKTIFSLSTPKIDISGDRAFVPNNSGDNRPIERLNQRTRGNFLLTCDVLNFYESIYTHSIPWAFHTKKEAKEKRWDTSLFGNIIDKLTRNSQDQQTKGIPTGTDTSFIIAESLLSTIDIELVNNFTNISGFRFFDDFEIVCPDEDTANKALIFLEKTLDQYDLCLNKRKTKITHLPEPIDNAWVAPIRDFPFSSTINKPDLINFTNLSFRLSKDFPHDPVLRYALTKLIFKTKSNDVWDLYQNILIQFLRLEPQVAHFVSYEFLKYTILGFTLDKEDIEFAIQDGITKYSRIGASNEIAWLVWMAIMFEIKIPDSTAQMLTDSEDCFVALLTLDALDKGRFHHKPELAKWHQHTGEEDIYSEFWLLCYESVARNWLPVKDGSNYINHHPCFGEFNKNNILFYDHDSYINSDYMLKTLNPKSDLYGIGKILSRTDTLNHISSEDDDLPF